MSTKAQEFDVVISGISGRFPESNNMEEFKQNLMKGVDLVTEDDRRWPPTLYNMPLRSGKLPHLDHFDAKFFKIPAKQAQKMDPQIRMLIECTFEALLDAGVNPTEVRGTRTGVYIGVCESESAEYWRRDLEHCDAYGLSGNCRTMFANRISYAFDFNGPNYVIDTGCASSMSCLHRAVKDIQTGECDAAIVGSSNLTLMPEMTLQFYKMQVLSPTGHCKVFDASESGYVRAETIAVVYLQKSSNARRIYATVVGSRVNIDGYKEISIGFPSSEMQAKVATELYNELNINPADVGYIEAHGTGTFIGDEQECKGVVKVFCKNRKTPMLIGSVKSNMGHSEGASGISSLSKLIITLDTGIIPANLHYKQPLPNVSALVDGRLKVVTTNEQLPSELVAINSSGVGGVNCHALLRRNSKLKQKPVSCTIPRLVLVSGRSKQSVVHLLNAAEEHKDDSEFLGLLDQIHLSNITGHEYRGYRILGETADTITNFDGRKRPIWFVISGMGSQWPGMAKQLMQLNSFNNSIKRSAEILLPFGVNLEELLTNPKSDVNESTIKLFVCIVSMQIALVDLLISLGIKPDGIFGHSLGETACAYADGAFTAEQTLLAAYYRGQAILQSKPVVGAMAAIGLGWKECQKRCPPEIILACNNSTKNVTVSGPLEDIHKFVEQLQTENIFAKVVKGAPYGFHSKYIEEAGPILKEHLNKVLPNGVARSAKWISTTIPDKDRSALSWSEYFVKNCLLPVQFYEAMQRLPKDAIVIEIAPDGILKSFIEQTLKQNVTYISIMKSGDVNNLGYFLSSIGKLYAAGGQPNVSQLYPPIEFPVGRGTPMISPLVEWDHSEKWTVVDFSGKENNCEKNVMTMNMAKEDQYLAGHVIDGNVILPGAGYLVLVWKAFAKQMKQNFEKVPMVMENVRFYRPTIVPSNTPLSFSINILDQKSNRFEMYENGSMVISGTVYIPDSPDEEFVNFPNQVNETEENSMLLNSKEIYRELNLRGYHYEGPFLGITKYDFQKEIGTLKWTGNWISFIDTIIQFSLIGLNTESMFLPTRFQRVVINPALHTKLVSSTKEINVSVNHETRSLKSGGIIIQGMSMKIARRIPQIEPFLRIESYKFVPFDNTINLDNRIASEHQAASILLQIVWDNRGSAHPLKIVEISGKDCVIKPILEKEPMIVVDYKVIDKGDFTAMLAKQAHLVVLTTPLPTDLKNVVNTLEPCGFLLLKQNMKIEKNITSNLGLQVISTQKCSISSTYLVLLRKVATPTLPPIIINATNNAFSWVEQLKSAIKINNNGTKIYLVTQSPEPSGLVGMVNCLIQEPGGSCIRLFYIENNNTEEFSITSPFYAKQITKDLVHNILSKTNTWGTYCYLEWQSKDIAVEDAHVINNIPGNLDSLKWVQSPVLYSKCNEKDTLCDVYYAALNFPDLMHIGGDLLPAKFYGETVYGESEYVMGIEFSGRDSSGKRVMGIVKSSGLATKCNASTGILFDVPEDWSLEEAATVPIAYITSYYALIVQGQIQNEESILIYVGSDGIGLAALSIALSNKCKVFVTASCKKQKNLVKQYFPQIEVIDITDVEQHIMSSTNKRGVDLIFTSLRKKHSLTPFRCLADGGRFLRVGPHDNTLFNIDELVNKSYFDIDIQSCLNLKNHMTRHLVDLVHDGVQLGVVKPLPRIVFGKDKIIQAFVQMKSGKYVEKVIVKIRDEEAQKTLFLATPRTYMDSNKSYIIIDGLTNFGVRLINWFVSRRVTKIITTSKKDVTGYQAFLIQHWLQQNVQVTVLTLDASIYKEAEQLVARANNLSPLGGIFNLTRPLSTTEFSEKHLETSMIKMSSTKHLDELSRKYDSLDYFVVFLGRSNAHQGLNAYVNSTLEKICEIRRGNGLPGLAVQLGIIEDINCDEITSGNILGMLPQPLNSCMAVLDPFLQQTDPVVSSCYFERREKKPDSVLDTIFSIVGVEDPKTLSPNTTLDEYGIDSFMALEIVRAIEAKYDLIIPALKIRAITFEGLADLINNSNVSVIQGDEGHGNVVFKVMPTEVLLEMSKGDTCPVFFIHPIEGHVDMLYTLANIIETCVYGLQYTDNCPTGSFAELAQYYIQQVKKVQPKGPYVFLGYSLGAAIGIEMAIQLEGVNDEVTLILIDGSQSTLANLSKAYNQNVMYMMAAHFSTLSRELQYRSVVEKILGCKTPEEKIAALSKILLKVLTHSLKEIQTAVAGVYHRMEAAIKYKPSGKFKGSVTLLRTKKNYIATEEDYGLGSVCTQTVQVFLLDGNHESIITGASAEKIAEVVHEVIRKL